jgi:hypothetical protein
MGHNNLHGTFHFILYSIIGLNPCGWLFDFCTNHHFDSFKSHIFKKHESFLMDLILGFQETRQVSIVSKKHLVNSFQDLKNTWLYPNFFSFKKP